MALKKYNHEAVSVGQAIQDMLKTYHLKPRFDEATLLSSWEKLAGRPVAKRTRRLFIRGKVLFVELDSPSLKHEVNLHKGTILEILCKEFGDKVIKEIVVM